MYILYLKCMNIMETPNLRFITFNDDVTRNYVIFQTNKYDVVLNDDQFQVIKSILFMNDTEILHVYNEIVNILDKLTILLLQADSSHIQRNITFISLESNDIHDDILKGCEDLKKVLGQLFDRMKEQSIYYNNKFYKQFLRFDQPNEVINKFNRLCDIIIDSFEIHALQIVTHFISIIRNNIIENEKDKLMKNEIKEAHNRNENVISIDSNEKETTTLILYVSKNNKIILSKIKNKKKKYLINIKNNTCTCPDFRLRKIKQDMPCKHLMKINNKSCCLLLIDKVMNALSKNNYNNSYVPFKKMLDVVYNENVDYKF